MPLIEHISVGKAFLSFVAFVFLYIAGNAMYNLYFHPLRNFPGPFLMRTTRATFCYKLIMGTLPYDVLDLHKKYGEVVRVAPNELAFAAPSAWNDIMGHRKAGAPEMERWDNFFRPVDDVPRDIISAKREEHSALRRQLAHGFSDKALRDQQPLIGQYIDLFIQRLHEHCANGSKALDIAAFYNFLTFDVIGDLAFGEPFGCLENSDYHPWVKIIFDMARVGTILQTANHFPVLKVIMRLLAPKSALEERDKHLKYTTEKIERRLKKGERPDLIEGLLKKKEELDLDLNKLQANGGILVIGGSETTATLLAGATYLLSKNPECLKKVVDEIRSAFSSESEIDLNGVNKLTYTIACLSEALRLYPPVPNGNPRLVPEGGATISGYYVPANTAVAVWHWAAYHNPRYFGDAEGFHPERFLGDPEYAGDDMEAFQPFHVGARNCIGRNLAHIEMRLVMARLLWNFDLALDENSDNWMDQKIYLLWNKGPLNVYLKPVVRGGRVSTNAV